MTSSADSVLARFPGPVHLYPSLRKWLLVMLGGLAFTAAGVLMIRNGEWTGWLVVAFFAAVAVVGLVAMLPAGNRLSLDADGFEARTLFRGFRKRWAEVGGFGVAAVPGQTLVVFDDLTMGASTAADMSVAITGSNNALSDSYGLGPEMLAALLNEWRARALGE